MASLYIFCLVYFDGYCFGYWVLLFCGKKKIRNPRCEGVRFGDEKLGFFGSLCCFVLLKY